ncbi:MAG: YceH family protein [bacterium]|nr:YceH family protein [bacterium]
MDIILTAVEARVLGSLIEKEITTPEYYPLSLNALTNACNQKSNRDPVMKLDETTIVRALDNLRAKLLVWHTTTMEGRVPKYKHNMETLKFSSLQLPVICELFLRGPQTLGELRTHTERMHKFKDLGEVEAVLQTLMDPAFGPYVTHLPREAGRKERRYAHLFCGEVSVNLTPPPEAAAIEVQSENKRIDILEQNIASLQKEVEILKDQFAGFKKQFE